MDSAACESTILFLFAQFNRRNNHVKTLDFFCTEATFKCSPTYDVSGADPKKYEEPLIFIAIFRQMR